MYGWRTRNASCPSCSSRPTSGVIYTANTIEALNRQIRKTIKTRGHFPHQDAARKLLYLAITNAQTNWRSTYNWSAARAAFRIHFADRLPDHAT